MAGRWCVIVVPGAGRQPLYSLRNHVVDCLGHGESMRFQDAIGRPQDPIRSLVPTPGVAASFEQLDIVEAYWSDLMPTDSETKPYKRLLAALALVTYWITDPKVWGAVFSASWFIALSYILTGFVVVAWAASVIIVAITALGPAFAALVTSPGLGVFEGAAGQVSALTDGLRGSPAMTVAQAIAAIFPLLSLIAIVDLARFSRSYLLDETLDSTVGIQAMIRNRLRTCFTKADQDSYERIIILAHSFGTLPLVDMLADWEDKAVFEKLKVITLGSPAGIFAFKSDWLRQQVAMAVDKAPKQGWIDFRLNLDFWCTGLLNRQNKARVGKIDRAALNRQSSLIDGLNGAQHMRYFRETAVQRAITA